MRGSHLGSAWCEDVLSLFGGELNIFGNTFIRFGSDPAHNFLLSPCFAVILSASVFDRLVFLFRHVHLHVVSASLNRLAFIFCYMSICMALLPPTSLILGHFFVRRLQDNLQSDFDSRADETFDLHGRALVQLHGVGGRTVQKLRKHDLHIVYSLVPAIIIVEIGTNDLSADRPEVVGSAIVDFVRMLSQILPSSVIGVCEVIPRGQTFRHASVFNVAVPLLNQYVRGVLESFPNVFTWRHGGFANPSRDPYFCAFSI